MADALQAHPGARVGYVVLSPRDEQAVRVRMKLEDDPHPNGLTSLWFHPATGDLLATQRGFLYDLATGALEKLDTPQGVVRGATARPDGTVELAWSSSALPPVIRRARRGRSPAPTGPPCGRSTC